jgi:3-hydroxyacyl-CoA dehydrogenase
MGAGLATHLANLGWEVDLLDRASGSPGDASSIRSRIAKEGLDRAIKIRPPQFALPAYAERIRIGNMEDDLERLAEADWIVEAVAEDMAVKKAVFATIAAHAGPDPVISSNTSGLSLSAMIADCPEPTRRRFLGTHFFNPPRYMKPVELIPAADTDPDVFEGFAQFADRVLGKRVIRAKDTPGFISTRLGIVALVRTIAAAVRHNLTVEEADYLTGPLLGRPKSGTFRLADVIGLDVTKKIISDLKAALPDDQAVQSMAIPAVLEKLVAEGRVGAKSGAGFYMKSADGVLSLDLETLEYRPRREPHPAGERLETMPLAERFPALWNSAPIRYRPFLRDVLTESLDYMIRTTPEVSDRIVEVDDALIGGFGWEAGPFHMVGYLQDAPWPKDPPDLVKRLRAAGLYKFYDNAKGIHHYFDFRSGRMEELDRSPNLLILKDKQKANGFVEQREYASLVDLDDGVLCLEWHTKMGTLNPWIVEMLELARTKAEADFRALVLVGAQDPVSAGFDLGGLGRLIQQGRWRDIDKIMHTLQQTLLRIKYSSVPIVCAVSGYTLGGGCEVMMHGSAVQAAFESSLGLPEANVGLIPCGGGIAQTVCRAAAEMPVPAPPERPDLFPFLKSRWENIRLSRFSSSAPEARALGYLRDGDGITVHPDRLLFDAKQRALALADGFTPPESGGLLAIAEDGLARFQWEINQLRSGDQITDHDARIALASAKVMCGGSLIHPAELTEQAFLDLEREEFLSLASTPESLARVLHMVETGKPLKN